MEFELRHRDCFPRKIRRWGPNSASFWLEVFPAALSLGSLLNCDGRRGRRSERQSLKKRPMRLDNKMILRSTRMRVDWGWAEAWWSWWLEIWRVEDRLGISLQWVSYRIRAIGMDSGNVPLKQGAWRSCGGWTLDKGARFVTNWIVLKLWVNQWRN